MSRSGYTDDNDNWELIRWRGAVASAIRGKRGQKLLREMLEALDAMPLKELVVNELITPDGGYCALGALGAWHGINMETIDPDDPDQVAKTFNVAQALVREIVFENDEGGVYQEQPKTRWIRMKKWVEQNILS